MIDSAFFFLERCGLPLSKESLEAQMISPDVLCQHRGSKEEVMIITLDKIFSFTTQGSPDQAITSNGGGSEEFTAIGQRFRRDWGFQATPLSPAELQKSVSCGYIRHIDNRSASRFGELDRIKTWIIQRTQLDRQQVVLILNDTTTALTNGLKYVPTRYK